MCDTIDLDLALRDVMACIRAVEKSAIRDGVGELYVGAFRYARYVYDINDVWCENRDDTFG